MALGTDLGASTAMCIDTARVRDIAANHPKCPVNGDSVLVTRSFLTQAAAEIEAGRAAQAKLKDMGL